MIPSTVFMLTWMVTLPKPFSGTKKLHWKFYSVSLHPSWGFFCYLVYKMAHTALHFAIYCSLNIAHRCKGILVIDKGFIALWQLNDNNCDIPLNKLLKPFFPPCTRRRCHWLWLAATWSLKWMERRSEVASTRGVWQKVGFKQAICQKEKTRFRHCRSSFFGCSRILHSVFIGLGIGCFRTYVQTCMFSNPPYILQMY